MIKKEVEIKYLPMEEKKRLTREGKMKWFFPEHVVEQAIICLFLLVLLITLATVFPPHLGGKANPFSTPAHIKPEWYFLAAYQMLKIADKLEFLGAWAPKILGVASQGIIILLLFMVPFIDNKKERRYTKRPLAMIMGILTIGGFIALTVWGHYS